jgi:hypothetical protein
LAVGFWFICLCLTLLAQSQSSGDERPGADKRSINIGSKIIEGFPSLGVLNAAEPSVQRLEVPNIFAGDEFFARFDLENGFASEIAITGVKTSCGCTRAAYDTKKFLPGAHTTIGLGIAPSKYGPFSISVRVNTSLGVVPIRLVGKVIPKLSLLTTDATYNADGEFEIPVSIADTSIKSDELKFVSGGRILAIKKSSDEDFSVIFPVDKTKNSLRRSVVPRIATIDLPPIVVSLQVPGAVELLTGTLISIDSRFSLVFRADPESVVLASPVILQSGNEYELTCETIRRRNVIVLKCESPSNISDGEVVVRFGERNFEREFAKQ